MEARATRARTAAARGRRYRRRRFGLAVALAAVFQGAMAPAGAARQGDGRVVTLDEAIRLALEHDPAAVAADAEVVTALTGVLENRGSWLPSVNVGSGYANSSNERFDQATGRLVSESYTAQVQGTVELFTGGRRGAQNRSARARVDVAEEGLRSQRYQTILAAKELFYTAVAAGELVAIADQRLDRARRQLEFAETRLEVGTATRSDVLRAELEVGNAELALVDAESTRRSARLRLGRLTGADEEVVPAPDAPLPERAPPLPSVATLAERAEQAAPQAVAARAVVEDRAAARRAALASYVPSLRISGGYDWFAFQFPPDQQSWSLRLTAALPVFNGFQREASVRRAAEAERVAEARARDAAIGARVAAEDAAREIGSAERRVAIAGRSVEVAREDLRVQEERYQLGVATILELQTSQLALADAEVAWIAARQALATAVARLEAVLGEDLDIGG